MSVDDLPKFEKMYRELGFVMSAHARDPKGRVMAFYNLKKIAQDEFHAHSDDEIMAFLYYLTLRMSLNQTMQERHVVIVQGWSLRRMPLRARCVDASARYLGHIAERHALADAARRAQKSAPQPSLSC